MRSQAGTNGFFASTVREVLAGAEAILRLAPAASSALRLLRFTHLRFTHNDGRGAPPEDQILRFAQNDKRGRNDPAPTTFL